MFFILFTDTFGPEHRPIVEFALDNVQKLKLRAEKIQAQQLAFHNDTGNFQQNNRSSIEGSIANRNSRKRKPGDGDGTSKAFGDKMREKNELVEEGSKKQKGSKRGERNNFSLEKNEKKPNQKVSNEQKEREVSVVVSTLKKGGKANIVSKEESKEPGMQRKRSILHDQSEQSKEGYGPKNRKRTKRSDPIGRDPVDKLDRLIEQYRSKFTASDSIQTGDKKQGSKNLKRWFES